MSYSIGVVGGDIPISIEFFDLEIRNGGASIGEGIHRKAGNMIHYVYSTRGGYLYMVGRYNQAPKLQNQDEFVLSVPEKTSQSHIDTLAHRKFMDHLRRPRKVNHDRHVAKKELATV